MSLSICIVNWNTRDLLRACLTSIHAYSPPFPTQIVVVDNASSDGSAEMVSGEFPNVTLIANDENKSYAAGNNQAISVASGDYILLLNPDTEIYEDTLINAMRFLETHPEAGAIGALQKFPDGRIQPSIRTFPYPLLLFYDVIGLSRLFPNSRTFAGYRMSWFKYDRILSVDQPMGTFLMTTRAVIERVGGMDEQFPLFFNDVDWCYRVKQAGLMIYFVPEVAILHHGGAGTSQTRPSAIRESHRALEKFYFKHFKTRLPKPVFYLSILLIRWSVRARIFKHPN